MKLATVRAAGAVRLGVITDSGFVDLTSRMPECPDLRTLLATDQVEEARKASRGAKPDFAFADITYLPPNARPDMRMFALGWAYKAHQLETGKEDMQFPVVFSKHPQSLVGSGQSLIRPRASKAYDYEGEIAIVIGKAGRNISAASARDHIAGYSLVMDGSARDYQKHSITAGKSFDSSSAFGPWLVTADEVGDPSQLVLTTRLNGVQMQHSGFNLMAWELGFLINYLSTVTRLLPGDVISTGTPAGVGNRRDPQLFMKAGDVIEVDVPGLGVLRNPVVDQED